MTWSSQSIFTVTSCLIRAVFRCRPTRDAPRGRVGSQSTDCHFDSHIVCPTATAAADVTAASRQPVSLATARQLLPQQQMEGAPSWIFVVWGHCLEKFSSFCLIKRRVVCSNADVSFTTMDKVDPSAYSPNTSTLLKG